MSFFYVLLTRNVENLSVDERKNINTHSSELACGTVRDAKMAALKNTTTKVRDISIYTKLLRGRILNKFLLVLEIYDRFILGRIILREVKQYPRGT